MEQLLYLYELGKRTASRLLTSVCPSVNFSAFIFSHSPSFCRHSYGVHLSVAGIDFPTTCHYCTSCLISCQWPSVCLCNKARIKMSGRTGNMGWGHVAVRRGRRREDGRLPISANMVWRHQTEAAAAASEIACQIVIKFIFTVRLLPNHIKDAIIIIIIMMIISNRSLRTGPSFN